MVDFNRPYVLLAHKCCYKTARLCLHIFIVIFQSNFTLSVNNSNISKLSGGSYLQKIYFSWRLQHHFSLLILHEEMMSRKYDTLVENPFPSYGSYIILNIQRG